MGDSCLIVKPREWHCKDPLLLTSGQELASFKLGYETHGELNPEKDNGILICHALTHSSHCAGKFAATDPGPGWWDGVIGPGKSIDTDHYFVICINCLGGCHGSTGPSSQYPVTGKPYGGDFPVITITDMVASQKRLADHLGIERFAAVVGGCMGGFQVLEWMVRFPENVQNVIAISTAPRTSPHTLALWEVTRQAIMSDPKWQKGHYYETGAPKKGMGLASMFGMMLWMPLEIMEEKYGRRTLQKSLHYTLKPEFEIQQLFQKIGQNAGGTIDPNTLIYLTRAMDYFDLTQGDEPLDRILTAFSGKALLLSVDSDWRYPCQEMEELNQIFQTAGIQSTHNTLQSPFGHGAFHMDPQKAGQEINAFLTSVYSGN